MLNRPNEFIHHQGMRLKKQLQLYLDEYGLTASQLSRKSHVSRQVLSKWLDGAEPRKIDQVKKVADSLGTSVDHLCFGTGIERTTSNSDLSKVSEGEWISGLFEVKLRRVKK